MSSKNSCKKTEDSMFSMAATPNQKAWDLIHDFYHIILTHMERNNITKSDLARKLGKSRAAVSQMFNKTPNISVKKMIEIADAIGININITSSEIEEVTSKESPKYLVVVNMPLEKTNTYKVSDDVGWGYANFSKQNVFVSFTGNKNPFHNMIFSN